MYHDLELLHHLDIEYDASTFDTDPFEPQPDGMGTIFPFWVPNQDRKKEMAKGNRGRLPGSFCQKADRCQRALNF
jgi:hypothetical protein